MASVKPDLFDPEKFVEAQVLAWAFQNGFCLDVYDSKGTFSKAQGRYTQNRGMKTGTPDLLGSSPQGFFVALELKAEKKGKVCRIEQRSFLLSKIEKNAFALVVSDVSFLQETWSAWLKLRNEGKDEEARKFLISLLPTKVLVDKKVISLVT